MDKEANNFKKLYFIFEKMFSINLSMITRGGNNLLIVLIFAFFFLIYITSSSGHFDPWDGSAYFLITESMVLKHSVTPTSGLPPELPPTGHSLLHLAASRALLTPAIAVPFYYAAHIFSVSPVNVIALLTNSFIMSLTCVVLFCFSLEVYKRKKIAFVLTLILGVCSFMWPYNNSLLSEPATTLCIFASAYFIYMSTSHRIFNTVPGRTITINEIKNKDKRCFFAGLGGLFLGMSVIGHPSSVLLVPGFTAYYIFSIRQDNQRKVLLIIFLIIIGGMMAFEGYTNKVRYGSFTDFGYGNAQSLNVHNSWQGLIGLLLSPGKGLIFYFPIAILLPLALTFLYRKNKGIFFMCIYTFTVFWLFFGTISFGSRTQLAAAETWSGGWWGSRYFVPLLPFITLASGTLLEHLKGNKRILKLSAVVILIVAGFLVNLLGIFVWFAYLYMGQINTGQSYELMTWAPNHSFIINHLHVLMSNIISHIQPEGLSAWSYGLAPCPYNLYLYCKYGILPVLFLGSLIGIITSLLLMKIYRYREGLSLIKD